MIPSPEKSGTYPFGLSCRFFFLSHKGRGDGAAPSAPSSPLVGEDSSPQEAKPIGEANLVRGQGQRFSPLLEGQPERSDPRPVIRGKIGTGSYEDPGEQKRKGRTKGKTGRPGR